MTYDELCTYLLRHPGAIKEVPIGMDIQAFKVHDKIFALLAWQKDPMELTLKSKTVNGSRYASRYPSILSGSSNNQIQWITVIIDGKIPLSELLDIIDESYELVLKSLKKAIREKLQFELI